MFQNRDEYITELESFYVNDEYHDAIDRTGWFPVFCVGRKAYVPCVRTTCDMCCLPIDARDFIFGEVHLDRVRGDSAYGFSPTHNKCWDKMVARSKAGDHLYDFFTSLDEANLLGETLAMFAAGRRQYLANRECQPEDEMVYEVVRDENPTRLIYPPHDACDCPSCDEARYNSSKEFDVDKFYEAAEFDRGFNTANDGPF